MKILKSLVLASAALFSAHVLFAQTADEIVARHIEALGGKEKLNQIKSLYSETATEVMGNEAPGKTYMINGKGFKSELDFNGQKIIQCFTDKGGWSVNPMGGDAAPQQMPAEQYNYGKNQIFAGGALLDYAAKGNKVELLGKEGNSYKIKVSTPEKADITQYIDTATYYISKSVSKTNFQGQEVPVTVSYSDYKKTDFGNTMPYKVSTDLGQFVLTTTVTKVEVNKEIDPKVFDKGQ